MQHGDRIRMLCVTSDRYPPTRVDVSVLFGRELSGLGHEIDWSMPAADDNPRRYVAEWGSGHVHVGRSTTSSSRSGRLIKNAWDAWNDLAVLARAVRQRYDLIQVKDKFLAAFPALAVARLSGTPFVFWLSYPFPEADLHAWREGTARYPWLYAVRGKLRHWTLYRVILPRADHCFVQSEQMLRDVAQEGIPATRMTPVPMGIDPDEYREEAAGPTNDREIVYLGTLIKERRLDFLLRVLLRVMRKHPDVKLVFVGDGEDPSDREVLELAARELGVADNVVFTGQLPRDQALARTRHAAVCLSPFYPTAILNSTSPTKLVEYLALGRPVVATDHPEQRLVLQQSGGGVCVPYEEDAFSAAVVRLLDDPDTGERLGRNGRTYVYRERSYGSLAKQVERVYLALCRRHGSRLRAPDRSRPGNRGL